MLPLLRISSIVTYHHCTTYTHTIPTVHLTPIFPDSIWSPRVHRSINTNYALTLSNPRTFDTLEPSTRGLTWPGPGPVLTWLTWLDWRDWLTWLDSTDMTWLTELTDWLTWHDLTWPWPELTVTDMTDMTWSDWLTWLTWRDWTHVTDWTDWLTSTRRDWLTDWHS